MPLPATDLFTESGGSTVALTTYSANWTVSTGNFMVDNAADNVYPNSSGAEIGAFWNVDTFNADQFSQVILSSLTAGVALGPCVRAATGGTYYGVYMEGSTYYLFRMNSGTWTQLATGTESWTDGDPLRLDVSGTGATVSLVMKHNGTQFGSTYNDNSGSRLLSGSAGICGYGDSSTPRLDNWQGGNLSGGGGVTLVQVERGRTLLRGLGRGLI